MSPGCVRQPCPTAFTVAVLLASLKVLHSTLKADISESSILQLKPRKHTFFTLTGHSYINVLKLTDWLTVGYICTVQTTKNTWRYHRGNRKLKAWNSLWSMPGQTTVSNAYMHRQRRKELLSLKEMCSPKRHIFPWVLVNLPLECGSFLQFSRRQNMTDAFVQPEALGWELPVKQWQLQHENLDLQAAKKSNMLCQRKKAARIAQLLKNEVETIIHLKVSGENTLRKTSKYILCVG